MSKGIAVSFASFSVCIIAVALFVVISSMTFSARMPSRRFIDVVDTLKTGDVVAVGTHHNLSSVTAKTIAHTEYIHAGLIDADNYGGETVVHEMGQDYPQQEDNLRIRGFTTLPVRKWIRLVREKWPGHIDATVAVLRFTGAGGDPGALRDAVEETRTAAPRTVAVGRWPVAVVDMFAPTTPKPGDDKLVPRMTCTSVVALILQRAGYISRKHRPAAFTPILKLCRYEPENYNPKKAENFILFD